VLGPEKADQCSLRLGPPLCEQCGIDNKEAVAARPSRR
jgi:hypothetical protein